jgi:hypothetical protein
MRLRTSDAPDGEGGNKWQRTGINDGAADPYCPGSRSGPSVLTRAPGPFLFGSLLDLDTAILDGLRGAGDLPAVCGRLPQGAQGDEGDPVATVVCCPRALLTPTRPPVRHSTSKPSCDATTI